MSIIKRGIKEQEQSKLRNRTFVSNILTCYRSTVTNSSKRIEKRDICGYIQYFKKTIILSFAKRI